MSEHSKSDSPALKILRPVGHGLYGLWFWIVFGCLASTTLCAIVLLPGQHRRRRAARTAANLAFRFTGSRPSVEGLHRLPPEPAVVVANHASYLDGILLTAVLPHRYRFVIKREVTRVPVMNFFLQRIGAHFVERFDTHGSARDARKIMQTAANGHSLAFFPEGTFAAEPGLRPFRNGAFRVAARRSLPLVPLTIRGTRQMLPAQIWLPRPAQLSVTIADPLLTDGDSDIREAMQHCRQRILQALDEPDLHPQDQKLTATG